MADKGCSERGFFGDIIHYDEHGKKIGTSSPSLFGGYNHYDSNGHKTGHSDQASSVDLIIMITVVIRQVIATLDSLVTTTTMTITVIK